jgi:hypothetical protein
LRFESGGSFEKGLYTNGPELLVAGSGVSIEEIGLASLHALKYRPAHFRKRGKRLMESIVLAFMDGKVNVGKRMRHFVEADILTIRIIGEFPDKVGPGKVDTIIADMSFEGYVVRAVAVFVLNNIDSFEIIQLKMIQPEGQLHSRSADKQWHRLFTPDIDIFKIFTFYEQKYPAKETGAAFSGEAL